VSRLFSVVTSIMVLSLSFTLHSQVDRAGTIIKINGNEIIVRNENPAEPFVMGETLHLLTGDKSVILQVTFPMQSSVKCRIISGSVGSLKIGTLVYSGGMPKNKIKDIFKATKRSNDIVMNIDDFETFLGLTKGDTLEKAESILGKPSKIVKSEKTKNSSGYYLGMPLKIEKDKSKDSIDYYWGDEIEKDCNIRFFSKDIHNHIIYSITINSNKYNKKYERSFYKSTTQQGSVHYLRSKGLNDTALDLFGLSWMQIDLIFGNPVERYFINDTRKHTYITSSDYSVVFCFDERENKLYEIIVRFD